MANKPTNLGRGLSSLLSDGGDSLDIAPNALRQLPIDLVKPSRFQPRHEVDEETIADLVNSIREKGVLQPIVVRPDPNAPDTYEIVAGERRWRASQLAQKHEIPVIIKDLSDRESFEIALIENLQRQDLSALEEADGYRRLMEEFNHTQEELARAVGKSRPHVTNMLRLLTLPDSIKSLLEEGTLSAGHARALLGASNPEALAQKVVAKNLNVRQTERLAKMEDKTPSKPKPPPAKDADTLAIERDLSNLLGLKVELKLSGAGGILLLRYATLDQLDDLLHRLNQTANAAKTPVDSS